MSNRHSGVTCDKCGKGNFTGTRMKCLQCYDFDLCANCFSERAAVNSHTGSHAMQAIILPCDFEMFYGVEYSPAKAASVKTYTCSYCAQPGLPAPLLVDHLEKMHSGESKTVLCPLCVTSTSRDHDPNTQVTNLLGHIQSSHTTLLTSSSSTGSGATFGRGRSTLLRMARTTRDGLTSASTGDGGGGSGIFSPRMLRRTRPSAGHSSNNNNGGGGGGGNSFTLASAGPTNGVVDISGSLWGRDGEDGGLEPVSELLMHLAQAKRRDMQETAARRGGSASTGVEMATAWETAAHGSGNGFPDVLLSALHSRDRIRTARQAVANGGSSGSGSTGRERTTEATPLSPSLVAMTRMGDRADSMPPTLVLTPPSQRGSSLSQAEMDKRQYRSHFVQQLLWSTLANDSDNQNNPQGQETVSTG